MSKNAAVETTVEERARFVSELAKVYLWEDYVDDEMATRDGVEIPAPGTSREAMVILCREENWTLADLYTNETRQILDIEAVDSLIHRWESIKDKMVHYTAAIDLLGKPILPFWFADEAKRDECALMLSSIGIKPRPYSISEWAMPPAHGSAFCPGPHEEE